jgi:kynurenine formamidase
MIITIRLANRDYKIDLENPLSIAIPLRFNGAQPNAYGVERAASDACRAGEIVGDTRRGGSVNFEQYTLIPHCNGTHTECAGHITHERIVIHDCLKDAFIPARLISVEPEKAAATVETYPVKINENDLLITRQTIEKIWNDLDTEISGFNFSKTPPALVVRTLPNDERKLTKTYLEEIPPFFSTEAMFFMCEIGIRHLLVDMPSIDRIFDEGKLSNHRLFWRIEPGSFEISPESLINDTITELVYVPEEIPDGDYLLNLQIAPFRADASPSRPVLFAVR